MAPIAPVASVPATMVGLDNLNGTPHVPQPASARSNDAHEAAGEAPACENRTVRPRCLSIDLEVGRQDSRIGAFGAVRGDTLILETVTSNRPQKGSDNRQTLQVLERPPPAGSTFVFPSPLDPSRPCCDDFQLWYRVRREAAGMPASGCRAVSASPPCRGIAAAGRARCGKTPRSASPSTGSGSAPAEALR